MLSLGHNGWKVAVETSGTVANVAAHMCDHLCVSPKLTQDGELTTLMIGRTADELRVVLPGGVPGWVEEQLLELQATNPHAKPYVQPEDPIIPNTVGRTWLTNKDPLDEDVSDILERRFERNMQRCIQWVHDHPSWSLSFQTGKVAGYR
jgi:organic radical activating enzyme